MEHSARPFVILISVVLLVCLSCLATFWFTTSYKCAAKTYSSPLNPQDRGPDAVYQWENREKNVRVLRTLISEQCFVIPGGSAPSDLNNGIPYHVIDQPISEERLAHLAGPGAIDFCKGFEAFELTREAPVTPRQRRGVLPNQCQDNVIVDCGSTVNQTCSTGPGSQGNGNMFQLTTACVQPTTFVATIVDRCKVVPKFAGVRRIKCYDGFYRDAYTELYQLTGRAPLPQEFGGVATPAPGAQPQPAQPQPAQPQPAQPQPAQGQAVAPQPQPGR